jgi:hypothetical protein
MATWLAPERATGALVDIGRSLLAGEYDSAILYQATVDANPDVLRVNEELGSPDDAWLIMGRITHIPTAFSPGPKLPSLGFSESSGTKAEFDACEAYVFVCVASRND